MNTRWYKTSAGALLLEAEKKKLASILPNLYGFYLLQVAPEPFLDSMASSLILNKFNTETHCIAHDAALPIASDSVDVVLLNHTLENTCLKDPFQILKEAYRVLIPGGYIIITGINPFSYWGSKLMLDFQTNLIRASKLKKWVCEVGFELTPAAPFSLASFLGSLFESLYIVVAVKQIIPLTLVKPAWSKTQLQWAPGEEIS